jgi:hypothetical protein
MMMDHPVRTLLYELFVEPVLQLLQRPFRQEIDASPKVAVAKF